MKFPSLFFAAFLLLAGCARTPPLQQPVEADTPVAFNMWRAKQTRAIAPEDWRWFDVAVQELKFQAMRAGEASGAEAIDAAVRKKIDGRPFADVLREGLQAHADRKVFERDELKAAIATNEKRKLRIKADDTDTLRDFAAHQERLRQKLAELDAEIPAILARLEALAPG